MKCFYLQQHFVVQPLCHVWLCNPWTVTRQDSLSFTISQSLLKFITIEMVMPSKHLILSWPLLLLSIFPSIRIFSKESALHIKWPKYWSFSFGISPFNKSVHFSCSVVSDFLRPHESQHARPPCPSPTPRVHSDSSPSSRWCHPTISSSVVPFSSCPQSFPASGFFFKWVSSSHQVAKVLELQLQHQSSQCIFRVDFL